jgi:hypothetical protein
MSQSKYRVYFLDSSGWLFDFDVFEADTDDRAITAVLSSNPGRIFHLWNDRGLVAKIGANQPLASALAPSATASAHLVLVPA